MLLLDTVGEADDRIHLQLSGPDWCGVTFVRDFCFDGCDKTENRTKMTFIMSKL